MAIAPPPAPFVFAHEKPQLKCSHCGKSLRVTGSWEDQCNKGNIHLELSGQLMDRLGIGGDHPVVQTAGAQDAELVWNNETEYRICRNCQIELIAHIGKFFKADAAYLAMHPEKQPSKVCNVCGGTGLTPLHTRSTNICPHCKGTGYEPKVTT